MARRRATRKPTIEDIPADRAGLPAKESIQSVETFVSPQNEEYTIIHTNETDAYDPPPKSRKPRTRASRPNRG